MNIMRFKWLVVVVAVAAVLITLIWRLPDILQSDKSAKDKPHKIEYLYVQHTWSDDYLAHTDRRCPKILDKYSPPHRIAVEDRKDWYLYCVHCVSDSEYKMLVDDKQKDNE